VPDRGMPAGDVKARRTGRRRGVLPLKGSRSANHRRGAGEAAPDCLLRPGNADSNTAAELLAALDLVLAQRPALLLQYVYV
jgi:hypothetical protein